jgi:hypothetical protein
MAGGGFEKYSNSASKLKNFSCVVHLPLSTHSLLLLFPATYKSRSAAADCCSPMARDVGDDGGLSSFTLLRVVRG